jgi:hypothetical protein
VDSKKGGSKTLKSGVNLITARRRVNRSQVVNFESGGILIRNQVIIGSQEDKMGQTTISEALLIALISSGITLLSVVIAELISLHRAKIAFERQTKTQMREILLDDLSNQVQFIESELKKYSDRFYFMLNQIRNTAFSEVPIKEFYSQNESAFILENIKEDPKLVSVFVSLDPKNELLKEFYDLLTQVIKMNQFYENYSDNVENINLPKRQEILSDFNSNIKKNIFNQLSFCYEKLYEAKEVRIKKIFTSD